MVSAAFPYQKKRWRVLGSEKAYVEVGHGDPIVLLHGNPTSSYLWRNVLKLAFDSFCSLADPKELDTTETMEVVWNLLKSG